MNQLPAAATRKGGLPGGPTVEITHLRKAYGNVVAVALAIAGLFPPATPLLTLAGYTLVFGFIAKRYFRWEYAVQRMGGAK